MTNSYRLGLRRLYAGGAMTNSYRLGLRRLYAGGAKTSSYRNDSRQTTLCSFSSACKAEEKEETLEAGRL
jgi:hypothetical protein